MKPSAYASRNSVAAVRRGMPTVIMIGSTIEPTMMIAPRPYSEVNSAATTPAMTNATTIGRSPPNSAA